MIIKWYSVKIYLNATLSVAYHLESLPYNSKSIQLSEKGQ